MRFVIAAVLGAACLLACGGDDASNAAAGGAGQRASAAGASGGNPSGNAAGSDPSDDDSCAEPEGRYAAHYDEQSGDCGDLAAPATITIPAGASRGGTTHIAQFPSQTVTTEVLARGCAVRLTQRVEGADGVPQLRIDDADPLVIGDDGRITGLADVTRYDASGEVECTGQYTVELEPMEGGIIGPSTGGSGSNAAGDAGAPLPEDVMAKLEFDCQQTVQCRTQRGDELPPDPVAECVAQTSTLLASDPSSWDEFVATVEACEQLIVCDYVNCATSQ